MYVHLAYYDFADFADSDHTSITGLLRFQDSKGIEIDIYCDGS